jgi:hypothetical protein
MRDQEVTKEELILILNELKAFEGSLQELISHKDTSNLMREWIVAWGPFCEYSNDITEYYPTL